MRRIWFLFAEACFASFATMQPKASSLPEMPLRSATGQPLALARFPQTDLRDVDCEHVRSSIVDWPSLRDQVQMADDEWQMQDELPKRTCSSILEASEYSDVLVVMARAADASAECALGALAAVLVLLVCAAECPGQASKRPIAIFEELWRGVLSGNRPLPAYMLGTSTWPVASLLAKWQAHCIWETSAAPLPAECDRKEVMEFSAALKTANEDLMPLIWRVSGVALAPERSIGNFASRILRPLTVFMNSAAAALAKATDQCSGAMAAQGSLLVLFRLLGPPVGHDPLNEPRLSALGDTLAQLSLSELVGGIPWPSMAVLAVSRHLAWRSHRIFREVPLAEIQKVLRLGSGILTARRPERPKAAAWKGDKICEALRSDTVARHRLWKEVMEDTELGALWRQLARWLAAGEASEEQKPRDKNRLQAPARASSPVFMSMGFGMIEDRWLQGFINRALDIKIQRFIFATPDKSWFLTCEKVRQERRAENSVLCVRTFNPSSRPYDHNNKAKFFLFPILLSLGVDISWLDLDIFVFKDPTHRLLEQAYGHTSDVKDVLVTDHFDEHCLNHGVFLVRASDRSLLWILRYIEWMHWYPFGHDQNGWDAFLAHSIVEPQLPDKLRSDPAINVSYGVLSTEIEYVTLTGWSGRKFEEALLLHFTTTQGMTFREKKLGVMGLLNATATRHEEDEDSISGRRMHSARWKALHRLRAPRPMAKRPCYEGIHMVVGQLLESGFYDELLA